MCFVHLNREEAVLDRQVSVLVTAYECVGACECVGCPSVNVRTSVSARVCENESTM